MTQIRSFQPYLASPVRVTQVASPPYDSMPPEERAAFGARHPENFINAIRSIEEFPDSDRLSLDELLHQNATVLEKLLGNGSFVLEPQPGFFVYQLRCQDHIQTGVVAEVPLSDYYAGLIRGHEDTRPDHEGHLCEYLNVVGAVSSPICAAYPDDAAIEEVVSGITQHQAWLDFTDDYGVAQKIWRVTDRESLSMLESLFQQIPVIYLTDGHHRVASGARHADRRNGQYGTDGPWNYLLMALFPADQMRILPFNRCVRDLGDLSAKDLLAALANVFSIEKSNPNELGFQGPQRRGEFVLLMDDQYYRLVISPHQVPTDPVEALDVSLLQRLVFEPLLGISNPRSDPRLDHVTGDTGLEGLRQRCRMGWRLGFACYPPSFRELMAVADAGLRMPPKSTCFDPKARSGIFVRRC